MSKLAYLDASALVKLVIDEPESRSLHRWYLGAERLVTSRVGVVETLRASSRVAFDADHRDRMIADLEIVELDQAIGRLAASLSPPVIRTLDAIHLATALSLAGELDAFVTYDDRLASAAGAIGLPVVRPA